MPLPFGDGTFVSGRVTIGSPFLPSDIGAHLPFGDLGDSPFGQDDIEYTSLPGDIGALFQFGDTRDAPLA